MPISTNVIVEAVLEQSWGLRLLLVLLLLLSVRQGYRGALRYLNQRLALSSHLGQLPTCLLVCLGWRGRVRVLLACLDRLFDPLGTFRRKLRGPFQLLHLCYRVARQLTFRIVVIEGDFLLVDGIGSNSMSSIAGQAVGLQEDIERCGLAHLRPCTVLDLGLRWLDCLYLHAVAFGDLLENGGRGARSRCCGGGGVNATAVMQK